MRPDAGALVIVAVAILFVGYALCAHGSVAERRLFGDVTTPLAGLVGAVWSLWGLPKTICEVRRGERALQPSLVSAGLLALSVVSFATGSFVWSYTEMVRRENPFPSWSDAGYVGSALFLVAGILTLPVRRTPTLVRVRMGLDSVMVMASLVTFSWFFLLGPTVLSAEESLLAKILGPFYPVVDLVLLLCVIAISARLRGKNLRGVRNLLSLGLCAYVSADVMFCYLNLHGAYATGNPLDVGWLVANLAIGQAARRLRLIPQDEEPEEATAQRPSLLRAFGPYALVPAVGGLLAYVGHVHTDPRLAVGVQIGATSLVALIIVRQAFAIVENARLYGYLQRAYRELEALATTDAMTGLWNHRMMQEKLRMELAAHEQSGEPLTLLLIDVDRFKAFNDQFGHPAGDDALRLVADVIRKCVRSSDTPARYGGEEFAAILPGTSSEEAMVVAERIRRTCEETVFEHRQVTLSIGVAQHHGCAAGDLIEAADRALYVAKHNGRNQTIGATSANRLRVVEGGGPPDLKASEVA